MSLHIEIKYANLLSSKLPKFKWKEPTIAEFRCPLCGDSKKSKVKKRGGFYVRKNKLMMGCFNCGHNVPFFIFLKELDPMLYKEYLMEVHNYSNDHRWYDTKHEKKETKVDKKVKNNVNIALRVLKRCDTLPSDHVCYQYLKKRKIPMKFWSELYYTDHYQKWINEFVEKDKFKKLVKDDPRLVIPFYNTKNEAYAYQGRTLKSDPKVIRYITIFPRESDDALLVYGINRLAPKVKDVYAFEGPIDSLYIPNSIAVAGSSLTKLLKLKKKAFIYVFDNEPRNAEIIELMRDVIAAGARIVIWPSTLKHKDVGQMIEAGMSAEEVIDIMTKNTYTGIKAELALNMWRVV